MKSKGEMTIMRKYTHEFYFTNGEVQTYATEYNISIHRQWLTLPYGDGREASEKINLNNVDRVITTMEQMEDNKIV